jgi:hypothetical protein
MRARHTPPGRPPVRDAAQKGEPDPAPSSPHEAAA